MRTTQSHASVAFITDAATPLGRTIALALAQQGWDLALHYQQAIMPTLALAAECEALGRHVITVPCLLTNEDQVKALLPTIVDQLGTLSCVVNNAAQVDADHPLAFSPANLEAHIRTNLSAPILLAQALYNVTADGAQAVIINLLDQKLFNPQPDFFSYTLSKAALHNATTLLAQALAPKVRVVGIAAAFELDNTAGNPMRLTTPANAADIAASVCFIASSRSITGNTLLIDNGQHLLPPSRATSENLFRSVASECQLTQNSAEKPQCT